MRRTPEVTVDGSSVVLDIRGKFDPQTALDLAAATRKAAEHAVKCDVNFYQPQGQNGAQPTRTPAQPTLQKET